MTASHSKNYLYFSACKSIAALSISFRRSTDSYRLATLVFVSFMSFSFSIIFFSISPFSPSLLMPNFSESQGNKVGKPKTVAETKS